MRGQGRRGSGNEIRVDATDNISVKVFSHITCSDALTFHRSL